MCRLFSFPVWLVVSLIWTAAVAYYGYHTVPYTPMDVSASDPATLDALRAATQKHVILFGMLAAVPPAIALLFGSMLCRRT
jgi:hypothetical protein